MKPKWKNTAMIFSNTGIHVTKIVRISIWVILANVTVDEGKRLVGNGAIYPIVRGREILTTAHPHCPKLQF